MANGTSNSTNMTEILTKGVRYMSFAGRGLISGLRRGMYKETNFVIDPKCLDQATQNYFINAFTTFGTPSFKWEE